MTSGYYRRRHAPNRANTGSGDSLKHWMDKATKAEKEAELLRAALEYATFLLTDVMHQVDEAIEKGRGDVMRDNADRLWQQLQDMGQQRRFKTGEAID
jgi:hypothetical protein